MHEQELISSVNHDMELTIPLSSNEQELRLVLADCISRLIETDFQKLVNLLYRLDVSETKLKDMLARPAGEDSGLIIAELIIQRQLQKIKSRQQFSGKHDNIDEEEKW